MDEALKNRFYQIIFNKNNYENILNHLGNERDFEYRLELMNDQQ